MGLWNSCAWWFACGLVDKTVGVSGNHATAMENKFTAAAPRPPAPFAADATMP